MTLERIIQLKKELDDLDIKKKSILEEISHLEQLELSKNQNKTYLGTKILSKIAESPEDKIRLFHRLFVCRTSVFPKLWINHNKGTKGYSPVCNNEWVRGICNKPKIKCSDCNNQNFAQLNENAINDHLRGKQIIGTYAIDFDDSCKFIACDFNGKDWEVAVINYKKSANELGIDVAIERSRSGNGAHAWIFFSEKIEARIARQLGTLILSKAQENCHIIKFSSFDRFFPNQDLLPKGGFGNLIALPLQKDKRELENSVFLDNNLNIIDDQWQYLSNIHLLSDFDVRNIISKYSVDLFSDFNFDEEVAAKTDANILNDNSNSSPQEKTNNISGQKIIIKKDAGIIIPTKLIPSRLITKLKRLATFPNIEFYKKMRMRLPTYPLTRFIFAGEIRKDNLILPRGVLEKSVSLLEEAKAEIEIIDERPKFKKIKIKFTGELTKPQKQAVRKLSKKEIGVLVATPGCGKTVMGCHLIAKRRLPTLVLVHKQPLINQWQSRILEFTDFDKKEIGIVSGSKKKPKGKIDIAMLQTLTRMGGVKEFLSNYDHIIIDECHHIPAISFEDILKQTKARYILGLTATPYRKDGLEKLLFYQCGDVVHNMESETEKNLEKSVIIKETGFRFNDEAGNNLPIHMLWSELTENENRNNMIVEDITATLNDNRTTLVISDRKEHLKILKEKTEEKLDKNCKAKLFRLDGELSSKSRREILSELQKSYEQDNKYCLFATSSLIGEGVDIAELDTLILGLPLSFEGRMVQYAGRLNRYHKDKTDIKIYDYLDSHSTIALKMYKNRVKFYNKSNYRIQNG